MAVGENGRIVHSADGDRWVKASDSATSGTLSGVAWNGERFAAVGRDGVIVYSADGDRWEVARNGSYWLRDVIWAGDRFVAVGDVGTVVQSSDGARWEGSDGHADGSQLTSIAWSGDRLVAVGGYGNTMVQSSDGQRWEVVRDRATADRLESVAWLGGRFIAVGWNGTIVTSPPVTVADGEPAPTPAPAETRSAAVPAEDPGPDRTEPVAGWRLVRSGGTFTTSRSSDPIALNDVSWNGERYIAVGEDGTILHGVDGELWREARASSAWDALRSVAWNGERFVAVGTGGATLSSSDGDRWERLEHGEPAEAFFGVAWAGDRFLAVGKNATIAAGPYESEDLSEDATPKLDQAEADALADDPEAASADGQRVVASAAGLEWELLRTGGGHRAASGATGASLQEIAWGGDRFVAVGDDGLIVHSIDGDRWQEADGSVHVGSEPLFSVVWGAGRLVAVGGSGTILYGDDGRHWIKAIDSTPDSWASPGVTVVSSRLELSFCTATTGNAGKKRPTTASRKRSGSRVRYGAANGSWPWAATGRSCTAMTATAGHGQATPLRRPTCTPFPGTASGSSRSGMTARSCTAATATDGCGRVSVVQSGGRSS